jgi:hypothetical protein
MYTMLPVILMLASYFNKHDFFFARFELLQSDVAGDSGLLELLYDPRRLESS